MKLSMNSRLFLILPMTIDALVLGKRFVGCLTLLFTLFSNSIFCQHQDLFTDVLKECNPKWRFKAYEGSTGTYEYILGNKTGIEGDNDIIKIRPIKSDQALDKQNVQNYIIGLDYMNSTILSNVFCTDDTYTISFQVFAIKNEGREPNLDFHSLVTICGEQYLLSYYSYLDLSRGRSSSVDFKCANKVLRFLKCRHSL